MTTKDDNKAASDMTTRAPNSVVPAAKTSADLKLNDGPKKDYKGMPEGYKPDTSVQYKAGKDGNDVIVSKDENGKTVEKPVNAYEAKSQPVLEELDKDHTYRDRVEAQARSLGITWEENETLESLLLRIRLKASS